MLDYLYGRLEVQETSSPGLLESILEDFHVDFEIDVVRPHGVPPKKFLVLRKVFQPCHFEAFKALSEVPSITFSKLSFYDPYEREHWWANSYSGVIAVVVRAAFEVPWQERSSSPKDYLYFCEKRKEGRLKRDAMVDFSKPLGSQKRVIASSEFDYFLSPMMIETLNLPDDCLRPIKVRGKISRWKRIAALPSTASVLHPVWNAPLPYVYPICGHKHRRPLGVWLAKENPEVPDGVADTEQKFGHVPHETTMVVSLEFALELIRRRAKVELGPVYSFDSETSETLRRFLGTLLVEQ